MLITDRGDYFYTLVKLNTEVLGAQTHKNYTGGHKCVQVIIISDVYWSLFLKSCKQNFEYFFQIIPFEINLFHVTFKN